MSGSRLFSFYQGDRCSILILEVGCGRDVSTIAEFGMIDGREGRVVLARMQRNVSVIPFVVKIVGELCNCAVPLLLDKRVL